MSNQKYPTEFHEEAVRQILECGYSVKEGSERLGISAHSIFVGSNSQSKTVTA
jgi:transposase